MRFIRFRRGFTLIELLIVVAIIGILAEIAVPNFLNAQVKAKLAQAYGNLASLRTAIGTYEMDWNWPPMDMGEETETGQSYRPLTTPVAYISGYGVVKEIFPPKQHSRKYYEYGASLRYGNEPDTAGGQSRVAQYKAAGVSFVCVSGGPDADTDWPWTDWAVGLQALKNPSRAGPNGDGGAFYDSSNGLGSSGDIIGTSAKVYQ